MVVNPLISPTGTLLSLYATREYKTVNIKPEQRVRSEQAVYGITLRMLYLSLLVCAKCFVRLIS